MTLQDLIFLAAVIGSPIIVSVRLFLAEPADRSFLLTLILAIVGSSLAFTAVSFVLAVTSIGGLGMFDGLIEAVVSFPIALITGLIVRARRRHHSSSEFKNAPNQ